MKMVQTVARKWAVKNIQTIKNGRLYQRLKIFFALLSIARKSEKGKAFCKELNLQVKTPEIDQVF